jgi:type I restriction enzyme S subunit
MNNEQLTMDNARAEGQAATAAHIPPGYKQTEVGVIPVEWEVHELGFVADIIDGDRGTHYPSAHEFSDSGFCLFLNAGNVTKNGFKFAECAFITKEKDSLLHKGKLERQDIVLTTRGTVGNIGYFDSSVPFTNIRINSGMVILRNNSFVLDTGFLHVMMRSQALQNQVDLFSFGSAQPQLTVKGISTFKIIIPPPPEQRAIAAALSDVDGLITALDRLIAKKRAIKQATMQQLLTGKTRLPGFGGAWEKRHVIEFGEVVTGGTPNTNIDIYWGEEYPWITPTDISTHRDMFTSERRLSWKGLNAIRYLPANSVLVTCIASIGKNAILKLQGGCNQQINAVIPNEHYSHEFLYYLFESSKKYLLAKAGITATSIVSKAAFEELNFLVPPLPEQRAIAAVLSDMDAEIAALEQRRAKTQAIKQGMMQQLLTGRIRLTTEEVNV